MDSQPSHLRGNSKYLQNINKIPNKMRCIHIVALASLALLASSAKIQSTDGVPVGGAEVTGSAFGLAVRTGREIDETGPRAGTYAAKIGNQYCPLPTGDGLRTQAQEVRGQAKGPKHQMPLNFAVKNS